MRAVTFQAPHEVRVEDKPEPELEAADDAIVKIEATGVCGSDLHIYHGRVQIDPGFTIGHEFVGTVLAAGDQVTSVSEGDRVLGCFHTACGRCFFCMRGWYMKCDQARVFGHGATLGSLQGTQADQALVPTANLTLRRMPEGVSDEVALFAGDVMGTGYHSVTARPACAPATSSPCSVSARSGCARSRPRSPRAPRTWSRSTRVEDRLEMARSFGAEPVHLTDGDPRGYVKKATGGRGVDVAIDAVGHPDALELAIRLARKCGTVSVVGVYAERVEVHMGLAWIKSLSMVTGHANVIAHVDPVLELIAAGKLDPSPLVTHHMPLEDAAEAYELYDKREALKIVLTP